MRLFKNLLFLASIVAFLVTGCSKDDKNDSGQSTLKIRLTDAPANYNAVYIDIQGVEVKGDAGNNVMLNVNPGIYNLLDFVNGVDTLIASGTISAGKISQIRLILGNNNTVVVDSVIYPLSTPSAQQSGLKLQVHEELLAGIEYIFLLDFDAQQSIVNQGNGSYSLKPVIRVVPTASGGSIKGDIVPPSEICAVTADNGTNQYGTYSDTTGSFLIMGIPQGAYTLTITPDTPLVPVVINGVNVINGSVTDVGQVNL